jgi:murein DD-endopeptidase MepM/ murein hydrolase activator NlpD
MNAGIACAVAIAYVTTAHQLDASSQTAKPIAITATPSSPRPGDLVVLTILTPTPAEAVRVRVFGRDLPSIGINNSTVSVLVGIDLAVAPGAYRVAIEAGATRTMFPLLVTTRKFATRTLNVDPAFVNPPASAVSRIQREAKELEQMWQTSTSPKLWEGAFVAPVPQPANSAFGTRTILNGEPRSPHSGADFGSPTGTPVKAPNAGRVVLADSLYYTGNTVVIDHGLGLYSLFAHLSEIDVHVEDMVKTGEVIGAVGATGRVTGPHLHWSVRVNGARVDPVSLLEVLGARRSQ